MTLSFLAPQAAAGRAKGAVFVESHGDRSSVGPIPTTKDFENRSIRGYAFFPRSALPCGQGGSGIRTSARIYLAHHLRRGTFKSDERARFYG